MLLIICGKMCSGKDTIVKRLINKGFKKVVTYTTRPKKRGEVDGVDYHYISKEDFEGKIKDGFFLEYRTCTNSFGETWCYGSAKQDILKIRDDQKKVIILSPTGVDKMYELKRDGSVEFRVIYLKCNDTTIQIRAKRRGDKKQEILRRIESDSIDFSVMDIFAQKVVWNDEGAEIGEVIREVLEYVEGEC